MPKIKLLPENVISKTAAGEVIERPASVVKELVENALDSGAAKIILEIGQSGFRAIQLSDDGMGMDKEDLELCLLPHTTSKIFAEEDLFSITSLGFRGEALSNISSLAEVTIKSKQDENSIGYVLKSSYGKSTKPKKIGMSKGTQVIVEDLFKNFPSRRKFLGTEKTEYMHILDTITRQALAYCSVSFVFVSDGKVIFDLPKDQTLSERARKLLGDSLMANAIPILSQSDHYKIQGFLTKPQAAVESYSDQYLYINGRSVSDDMLSGVVKNSYGELLEPRSHPPFILFVNLPHEFVDVNIHPRKERVKFVNATDLRTFVGNAVRATLSEYDLTYKEQAFDEDVKAAKYLFNSLKENVMTWDARDNSNDEILQVNNLYLIASTSKGIVIVDQHAAHERILYEQFCEAFRGRKGELYELPEKVLISLAPLKAHVLLEHLPTLLGAGFGLEHFGDNQFIIRKIPILLRDQNIELIINEMIDDIISGRGLKEINNKSLKTLAYLACRSAIKAGDALTYDQRKELLRKLNETDSNYTCPHGRPVKVEISLKALARMFKRTK